ncbi:MAG TPA: 3-deoxy-7-phosphoheptulonate synthase [Thermodesulfobacteriota bacterium]|nr:3-deoxy-7-phosphoheptulonate synthase [Thermodesulfobacteriota bacterium]
MIIVMKPDHQGEEDIARVVQRLEALGYRVHVSRGTERTIIGAIGDEALLRAQPLDALPGVERVVPILKPYKLASREFKPEDTVIPVNGAAIGGRTVQVIAGPCSVESRGMLLELAHAVKEAGAKFLRGGAFKPRTSPYSFQGLGEKGLEYLAEAREATGLRVVTELMDAADLPLVLRYTDVIQIGARNMQNFRLLSAVGRVRKPVMLKRGFSATIHEFLLAAEYIMTEGNREVFLCERGIRTFETATRNTLDLSAVPLLKEETHLPVIVDPSHATGKWSLVEPLARAAVAAGADGVMIEVHAKPEEALCDGPQALKPERLYRLVKELRQVAAVIGRDL